MRYAVLFPGQGSQYVGMGAELFDVRPDLLGARADDVLGWSLRQLCLEGPEEQLTRTEHAQPALFALAFALWDEVAGRLPAPPAAAAGHSLGEYTALVAAGVLGFDEALRVVDARGRAMSAAADTEPSGMAALLGVDVEAAEAVATANRTDGGRLTVANINAPGQVVVAGASSDLDWLDEHGRTLGVRRSVRLKVAGAFHSSFMQSAADSVADALERVTPATPRFPVYANVTARPVVADQVVDLLTRQVVSPVRFAETLEQMGRDGVDLFVHVGPGDVTAGMAKRTVPDAEVVVIDGLEAIEPAIRSISAKIEG